MCQFEITDRSVFCACKAVGLLQLLSLKYQRWAMAAAGIVFAHLCPGTAVRKHRLLDFGSDVGTEI